MKSFLLPAAIVLFCAGAAGCAKKDAHAGHDHAAAAPAKHEHHAPHDGTAIVLGKEEYHLEFVLDAATGKLTAYVLDGELENFIRVKAPAFEVVATVGAEKKPLTFQAIANPATGEAVGDTSQFEAQADWLKTTKAFDAELAALKIRNATFLRVKFNFPKGNDKD